MVEDFSKEFPKFKEHYHKQIQQNSNNQINTIGKKPFDLNSSFKMENLSDSLFDQTKQAFEFWDKINTIKISFETSAAISTIAAAGFWAAAWFFGISVPWAVAATAVATSLNVTIAGISLYLTQNNPYIDNLRRNINLDLSIKSIAESFWSIVYPFLTMDLTTVSATSTLLPGFWAVVATISTIYVWITKTSIFTDAENNKAYQMNIDINSLNPKINFKRIGNISTGQIEDFATIKLFKWTYYADTFNEFLQNFSLISLKNSIAQAGGQGSTITKEKISLSTSLINNNEINQNNFYYYNNVDQNLISYKYNFIVASQESYIDIYLFKNGDEIDGFLENYTESANAIYHVWNSLKVDSFSAVTNLI